MKKILIFLLVLCMLLSLSGCALLLFAGEETESNTKSTVNKINTTEAENTSSPYEITYSSVKTYKDSIGTTWAQVIVEIENTGLYNLFLESGICDLEDTEGTLVASKNISVFPQIIAPGEKAYYYDEYLLDSLAEAIELRIIPRLQVKKSTSEHITYPVTDVSITDFTYGGLKVMGRVENTTNSEDSMIYVVITLFNEASEPIGLAYTILADDLTPGEKVGFELTASSFPNEVTADSVASYTAVAYPHQYQIFS